MAIERTKDVLIEDGNINFDSLFLSKPLLCGLKDYSLIKPSPIQLKAIPLGKCGFDLIIKSKSGTGKTAVFAIIALEMIDTSIKDLQVLILAPTREIAVQSRDVITAIGKHYKDLKVEQFIGGLPVKEDKLKAKDCQIAVGSPGRILHLLKQKTLDPKNVKLFVLDEADSLMETSYQADINQIYHSLPKNKQMLAVSATYPNQLDAFLAQYMQIPTLVSPQIDTPLLLGLKHFLSIVPFNVNIIHLTKTKNNELLRLLKNISFTQCLVFCNYQTRAENVSNFLNANEWKCNYISGAQSQKQRLEVLKQLKEFHCRILLSTDLTARGIDAINVDLVINYDVPNDECTYLHRMGRAGRYGSKGLCITIASKGDEVGKFTDIIGNIGGSEMCVPVLLRDEIPDNVWEADISRLEQVKGTVKVKQTAGSKKDILTSLNEIRHDSNQLFGNKVENLDENKTLDILNKLAAGENISENEKIYDFNATTSESLDSLHLNSVSLNSDSDGDDQESLNLLKKLASGQQLTNSCEKSESKDILSKNISLLTVSSLLDDDKMSDDDDDNTNTNVVTTIENYIMRLKDQEKEQIKPTCSNSQENITKPDIEDLFIYAYDHAVSKTNQDWSKLYNFHDEIDETNDETIAESHNEPVNLLQDLLAYVNDEDEPEYDENYYNEGEGDEYDEEVDDIANESEVDGQPVNPMQWMPVASTSTSNEQNVVKMTKVEHFNFNHENVDVNMSATGSRQVSNVSEEYNRLYKSAVDNFNHTFNSLENVRQFENAWMHWQQQMDNVRDYVQQNIYLEEMNLYKNNK